MRKRTVCIFIWATEKCFYVRNRGERDEFLSSGLESERNKREIIVIFKKISEMQQYQ